MKKNVLKTIVVLLVAILCGTATLSAQEQQEQQNKTIAFNFINEYGFFVGRHVGWTGVFINGIAIKQTDLIGLGVGYGLNTASFQEIPIFLNYRHYFERGRKLKPCINAAAGIGMHIWDDRDYAYYNDYEQYDGGKTFGVGLYATIAGGFRVKALSFTGGFFFRTFPTDSFTGGIEAKIGYTF